MASKIEQLTPATLPLSSPNCIWIEQSGVPRQLTWEQLQAALQGVALSYTENRTFLNSKASIFTDGSSKTGRVYKDTTGLQVQSEDNVVMQAQAAGGQLTFQSKNLGGTFVNGVRVGGSNDDFVYGFGGDGSPSFRTRAAASGSLEGWNPELNTWSRIVNAGTTSNYANPNGTLAARASGVVFNGVRAKGNWYTIAKNPSTLTSASNGTAVNGGAQATARFTLIDSSSGNHQSLTFQCDTHFQGGQPQSLTVIANNGYSGPAFSQLRVLFASGTYGGAFLQVYINGDDGSGGLSSPRVFMFDDVQNGNWTLVNFELMNTVPTGFTAYTYDVTNVHAGFYNNTVAGQQGVKFLTTGALQFGSVGTVYDIGSKTYGAVSMAGYKNNYSGIAWPASTGTPTFMMRSDGLHGVYFQDLEVWGWYHDRLNGVFKVTDTIVAINGARLEDGGLLSGCWTANTQNVDYTLQTPDRGKMMLHTSGVGHIYYIPTNASAPFPLGTRILIANPAGSATLQISPVGGVTLRKAGTGTSGDQFLTAHGIAFLTKVATDIWYIDGDGL